MRRQAGLAIWPLLCVYCSHPVCPSSPLPLLPASPPPRYSLSATQADPLINPRPKLERMAACAALDTMKQVRV